MAFTLTINGTEHQFKFGMRFIRELDKTKEVDANGVKFGVGVEMGINRLVSMNDPEALEDILISANAAADEKLTVEEMDAYLEDDNTNIDELTEKVIDALLNSKFTSKKVAAAQQSK
ncbi:tail assembly chaperone [Eupransor demetentiae]|uniref:Phage tail protein n=1 Tax=Eupransor demetentiae TaxID=3109584 RepID=A0ABP0EPR8_9LACO|nr:hypothetical protein R54876_GBNLAHCA_00677 [Lactobacillaceae bacterium LMG 33000]